MAGKGWLGSAVDRAVLLCTSHFEEEKGAVLTKEVADDGETLPDVEIMVVPIGSSPELLRISRQIHVYASNVLDLAQVNRHY